MNDNKYLNSNRESCSFCIRFSDTYKSIQLFTVDFNKEHSGVFGGVLDDQRLYLELCVKTVLNLYKNVTNPPTSVSIVAHSLVIANIIKYTRNHYQFLLKIINKFVSPNLCRAAK